MHSNEDQGMVENNGSRDILQRPRDRKPKTKTRVGSFNFNACRVFLTLAQCDGDVQDVRDHYLRVLEDYKPYKWVVAREKHKDGGTHFHVIMCCVHRIHTRDCRFFEYGDKHPHIQAIYNLDDCRAYCKKDGEYIEEWPLAEKSYRSTKADIEAYDADKAYLSLQPAIPFRLLHDPSKWWGDQDSIKIKCRHLLYISPPDYGKTSWVEREFRGKAIYKRVSSNYPFDDYRGESVIIYDDFWPSLEEVLVVSNTYGTRTPVYGNTRYTKKYWPIDQSRFMIILCNDAPGYIEKDSFKARFEVIDLTLYDKWYDHDAYVLANDP